MVENTEYEDAHVTYVSNPPQNSKLGGNFEPFYMHVYRV